MLTEAERKLSIEQHIELTQTLYLEARLLDDERYDEWLNILSEGVRYVMPITARRFRKDRGAAPICGSGYIFDEDKPRLSLRVKRLQSGMVWAEDPRNAIRRIVSNVEIYRGHGDYEALVYSVIDMHRSRMDAMQRRLTAGREDRWTLEDGQWRLIEREIMFDHPIVIDSNLNAFF